jgi:nucleotide-binding universal stress UspA family protein
MNGIVVGVDGSTGAAAALSFAVAEARLRGSVLHAVAAWDMPAAAYPLAGGVDDLPVVLQQGAEDALTEALAGIDGVTVERHVFEGHPARVLLEAATGADLLVVGSRGLGGFARLLLGSTGQEVVHHAPCPVVVVPAPVDGVPSPP